MSRFGRLARMTLVLAMLAGGLVTAPGGAHAADAGYEHIWQARALFAGETGQSQAEVLESSAEMAFEDGRYRGRVTYADLLGVVDATGAITSQEARIELELAGDPLEGGTAAGGTFTGQARLTVRSASSLAAAVSAEVLAGEGVETVFDVRGHWGALLEDGTLAGEIIYERARVVSGDGVAREPAWFNRASLANPDGLGDPQLLKVEVSGRPDGGGDGDGSDSGDDDTDEKETPPAGGSSNGGPGAGEQSSVLDYIVQGLRGGPTAAALPVPDREAAAARRLLDSRPVGARALPADAVAIDVHLASAYLDAKNRAAGVPHDGDPVAEAVSAAAETRSAAPRTSASTESPANLHIDRIRAAVDAAGASAPGNAEVLLGQLELIGPQPDREQIALLRTWASVAEALAASAPLGSVLGPATSIAADVAGVPVAQEGPLAEAVLAAADSYLAPSSALVVATFEPAPEADLEPQRGMADASLPGRVLALHGSNSQPPVLTWTSSAGRESVAPERWLAYDRADGTRFWLAGEGGEIALTDASVRGWAFSRSRAALVDATRCGRVIEFFRAE